MNDEREVLCSSSTCSLYFAKQFQCCRTGIGGNDLVHGFDVDFREIAAALGVGRDRARFPKASDPPKQGPHRDLESLRDDRVRTLAVLVGSDCTLS